MDQTDEIDDATVYVGVQDGHVVLSVTVTAGRQDGLQYVLNLAAGEADQMAAQLHAAAMKVTAG